MYGKLFASTFTGSMVGAGTDVFATWGYAIANADAKGAVELNPRLLSAVLGSTPAAIATAIAKLCAEDPESRTKVEEGRRMVREGTFIYRIVNYPEYRRLRDEDERKSYQRKWTQDKRAKSLNAVDRRRPPSTQEEEEEEVKEYTDPEASPPAGVKPDPPESERWKASDWLRHFGRFWAERKGRMVYGLGSVADAKATRDLEDIVASIPDAEKLKAERAAPEMFRLYLAEEGSVAKAQHPWSWFVVRFNALLTDVLKAKGKGASIVPGWTDSEYPE